MSSHTARLGKYLTQTARQDWSERQVDISEALKELNALQSVARAAESYCRPTKLPNAKFQRLAYLEETLQQLRASGEGNEV